MSSIYRERAKYEFAHYGFTRCPLSDEELDACEKEGLGLPKVYSIGCDVNAGFPFSECLDEAVVSMRLFSRRG